jgi:hypothetical protein
VQGDGRSARLSQSRAAILAALREAGAPLTPAQLAERCGLAPDNVKQLLAKLRAAAAVELVTRGLYTLAVPAQDAASPVAPPITSITSITLVGQRQRKGSRRSPRTPPRHRLLTGKRIRK